MAEDQKENLIKQASEEQKEQTSLSDNSNNQTLNSNDISHNSNIDNSPNANNSDIQTKSQEVSEEKPLSTEEQNVLFTKLDQYRKEIYDLRTKLNALNEKKETAYKNKETVSKQIIALISNIKKTKTQRDTFTQQVKESKSKRTELNAEINTKIEEIKKLNKEKRATLEKYHLEGDPAKLKKELEGLEFKLETEAFSPSEEKKLMKIIKEKKKMYNELKGVSGVFEKVYELSNEIDKLKRKADEAHKKLRSKADTSQEKHQELVETSKEIDELRKKEKEANDIFYSLKKEFNETNRILKQKLSEVNEIRLKVGEFQKEKAEQRKKERTKSLDERKRIVEEKLIKGKKLTTEDLIAMQG